MRAQLAWQPGDYALTRPRSRTPSSIIDQHTAGLLEQFREPCRIVDAIIRYSDAAALDPHETLERAFPVLQCFLNAGLLMPPDSALAQPIAGTLKRGEVIAGYTVIEAVQIIVDTEVYLVRTLDGAFAALKMARPGAEERVRRLFEAEAETLAALDGRVTPCLIDCGEIDGRPFLAMSWRAGVDGYEASAGARGDSDTGDLLRMASTIADAYAHLHEQNVLQGDVHPRNVLIDAELGVTLIDFGMAEPRVATGGGHRGRRGAVELFADPELAAAQRAGDPLPPISAEGEQYSVAALLYSLADGRVHTQLRARTRRHVATARRRSAAPLLGAQRPGPAGGGTNLAPCARQGSDRPFRIDDGIRSRIPPGRGFGREPRVGA